MANRKHLNPTASRALDALKNEIASEMGVQIGADAPSRLNGAVGGEMVKRMIALAEANLK